MAKKKPANHRYSSFDAIEGATVHLRLVDQDESVPPTFADATLAHGLSGKEGARMGTFFVKSTGETVPGISEINYVAWTRY